MLKSLRALDLQEFLARFAAVANVVGHELRFGRREHVPFAAVLAGIVPVGVGGLHSYDRTALHRAAEDYAFPVSDSHLFDGVLEESRGFHCFADKLRGRMIAAVHTANVYMPEKGREQAK